jgi:hypothetical protein
VSNSNGHVPKSFVSTLEIDRHVVAALALLPRVPDTWPAARDAARAAEWKLIQTTSLDLTDNFHFRERTAREIRERIEMAREQARVDIVRELEPVEARFAKMAEDAAELLAAAPDETKRRAKLAIRLRNLKALDTARSLATRREYEGYHATGADAEELLKLAAAVDADQAEIEAEVEARDLLMAKAEVARENARAVLIAAMKSQVSKEARAAAEVLGNKAGVYAQFPKLTPAEFAGCYSRAVKAARAADALGNHDISPLEEFAARLNTEGQDVLAAITGEWRSVSEASVEIGKIGKSRR